jgi:hypothetical protein
MRKARTELLEQGTQAPSNIPSFIRLEQISVVTVPADSHGIIPHWISLSTT